MHDWYYCLYDILENGEFDLVDLVNDLHFHLSSEKLIDNMVDFVFVDKCTVTPVKFHNFQKKIKGVSFNYAFLNLCKKFDNIITINGPNQKILNLINTS